MAIKFKQDDIAGLINKGQTVRKVFHKGKQVYPDNLIFEEFSTIRLKQLEEGTYSIIAVSTDYKAEYSILPLPVKHYSLMDITDGGVQRGIKQPDINVITSIPLGVPVMNHNTSNLNSRVREAISTITITKTTAAINSYIGHFTYNKMYKAWSDTLGGELNEIVVPKGYKIKLTHLIGPNILPNDTVSVSEINSNSINLSALEQGPYNIVAKGQDDYIESDGGGALLYETPLHHSDIRFFANVPLKDTREGYTTYTSGVVINPENYDGLSIFNDSTVPLSEDSIQIGNTIQQRTTPLTFQGDSVVITRYKNIMEGELTPTIRDDQLTLDLRALEDGIYTIRTTNKNPISQYTSLRYNFNNRGMALDEVISWDGNMSTSTLNRRGHLMKKNDSIILLSSGYVHIIEMARIDLSKLSNDGPVYLDYKDASNVYIPSVEVGEVNSYDYEEELSALTLEAIKGITDTIPEPRVNVISFTQRDINIEIVPDIPNNVYLGYDLQTTLTINCTLDTTDGIIEPEIVSSGYTQVANGIRAYLKIPVDEIIQAQDVADNYEFSLNVRLDFLSKIDNSSITKTYNIPLTNTLPTDKGYFGKGDISPYHQFDNIGADDMTNPQVTFKLILNSPEVIYRNEWYTTTVTTESGADKSRVFPRDGVSGALIAQKAFKSQALSGETVDLGRDSLITIGREFTFEYLNTPYSIQLPDAILPIKPAEYTVNQANNTATLQKITNGFSLYSIGYAIQETIGDTNALITELAPLSLEHVSLVGDVTFPSGVSTLPDNLFGSQSLDRLDSVTFKNDTILTVDNFNKEIFRKLDGSLPIFYDFEGNEISVFEPYNFDWNISTDINQRNDNVTITISQNDKAAFDEHIAQGFQYYFFVFASNSSTRRSEEKREYSIDEVNDFIFSGSLSYGLKPTNYKVQQYCNVTVQIEVRDMNGFYYTGKMYNNITTGKFNYVKQRNTTITTPAVSYNEYKFSSNFYESNTYYGTYTNYAWQLDDTYISCKPTSSRNFSGSVGAVVSLGFLGDNFFTYKSFSTTLSTSSNINQNRYEINEYASNSSGIYAIYYSYYFDDIGRLGTHLSISGGGSNSWVSLSVPSVTWRVYYYSWENYRG